MKPFKNMFVKPKTHMESITRTDSIELNDTYFTDEGYLIDKPIVTRVGIFDYQNPDGSIRKELRLPEEVFNPESLASYKAKPVIVTHNAGYVDVDNIDAESIGTILSDGIPEDNTNVRAEIVIHDTNILDKTKYRALSLGYSLDIDDTPGEWQGQHYDVIQRNIRINHLALVKKARAGDEARLNIDGKDEEQNQNEGGINLFTKNKNQTRHDDGNSVQAWRDRRASRKVAVNPEGGSTTPAAAPKPAVNPAAPSGSTLPPKEKENLAVTGKTDQEQTNPQVTGTETVPAPFDTVKANQARRDLGEEPADVDSCLQMIAEQDEDLQSLLNHIEQLEAKLDMGTAADHKDDDNKDEDEITKDCNSGQNGDSRKDRHDSKDGMVITMTKAELTAMIQEEANRLDELKEIGRRLNLDGLDTMPDLEAKKAVIKKVNPEIRLDGKGKAYISAAYDLAKEKVRSSGINKQREQMFRKDGLNLDAGQPENQAEAARDRMIKRYTEGGNN